MSLRPDDQALAAFLIETEAIAPAEVARAIQESVNSDRDLGQSLVFLELMQTTEVVAIRAEVAKQRELIGFRPALVHLNDSSELSTISDEDFDSLAPDTVMELGAEHRIHTTPDSPAEALGRRAPGVAESWEEATHSPADSDWEEQTATPAAGADYSSVDLHAETPLPPVEDWAGIGPTKPYEPSSEHDALHSQTMRPGPASSQRARPVVARSRDVDVVVSPIADRLAPSGRSMDERYQVLGEIGRGGMGRIIKARDTEIGREVALKVLLGGPNAGANVIRRFWTEVQATGQLEHPSIIPIHDVGRLGTGELFYVMKKLGGRTLAEIVHELKERDRETLEEFPRARLLTIFQQIAYAVAFAHARGVIHRDIKPANIMIGRYGEAILIDWGLAKIAGTADPAITDDLPQVEVSGPFSASETASGTITGTPQYMSPEATEGKPELLTSKSDVYGLGATLYELLTLEPAFADIGFVPTVVKVRQGEFLKPSARLSPDAVALSPDLEDLVLAAMAPSPKDRPSAKRLADDIGNILEGAKERQRRTAEAKARIHEGRRSTERWKTLKVELQNAESESKRLAKQVPPWADLALKQNIWRLEDRVSELKIEAVAAFAEAEAQFLRALGEVPDEREARSALAALYFARFGEAERARDYEGQRYYRSLVSRYDDGVWERVLEGDGSIEITTDPPNLRVSISRYVQSDRVLRAGEGKVLGNSPIARFDIPIGSYQIKIQAPGERDLLRPVLIGRTESVSVHINFRGLKELGEGFVLVPPGPAILGGDAIAHGGQDRRVVDVGEFAIAKFPVTCDEYLAFVNAVARDDVERARAHVPRARAQEGYYWRYSEVSRAFEYPDKSPGGHAWVGTLPVNGISMADAEAYVAWRSALTGERLRLPHENEWEKAARGVDGRFFPWGDHFEPTFCKMKESRNAPYPEPEPVGAFPTDCSPYMARDMAGSIRELCVTEVGAEIVPVMRGGCWHDTGLFCRIAFRHLTQPDFVNTGLGFRLAKDLG